MGEPIVDGSGCGYGSAPRKSLSEIFDELKKRAIWSDDPVLRQLVREADELLTKKETPGPRFNFGTPID